MHFVSNELVREFTSVYECWADCLNQDLLDSLDFQDAACLAARTWLGERLREMYVRLREFTRVCGLSESGFAGFFGFAGCGLSRGKDVVGRAFARDVRVFTRVYESLRVVWTAVLVIRVLGCDVSLAGAGVLVPLSARVVRELYEL